MKTYLNKDVRFCMHLDIKGLCSFIDYWADIYDDPLEHLYEDNIEKPLTDESIVSLYTWKNGGKRFFPTKTIESNYQPFLEKYRERPIEDEKLKNEFLNHQNPKGTAPVLNIFFLHILSKNPHLDMMSSYVYPIFDQHVYRAMCFMEKKDSKQLKPFAELEDIHEQYRFKAYEKYRIFYKNIERDTREYLKKNGDPHGRKIDKALFSFGKFLKKNCSYQRYF